MEREQFIQEAMAKCRELANVSFAEGKKVIQKNSARFIYTIIANLRSYKKENPEGFSINGEGHLLQEDTADHIADTFDKVIDTLISDMISECKDEDLGITPEQIQEFFDREK